MVNHFKFILSFQPLFSQIVSMKHRYSIMSMPSWHYFYKEPTLNVTLHSFSFSSASPTHTNNTLSLPLKLNQLPINQLSALNLLYIA